MTKNKIQQLFDEIHWTDRVTLGRNEFLNPLNKIDDHIYLVQKGSLQIILVQENSQHIIRFGYPGNLITYLDTFLTGKPSQFQIKSLKNTYLKSITKSVFFEHLYKQPKHLEIWNAILQKFVLEQMEREIDLLIDAPSERLDRVLKRSPELFQHIPHKYIAQYLRMTPETLSRIRKS